VIATKLEPDTLPAVDARTHVVVAFPPDGETDARIAPLLRGAGSIAYISTTGVYGSLTGRIDDTTQIPSPTARAQRVLDAEAVWRASFATVLRCPAIYGADRGLHLRIARGEHRIAGDGSSYTSRIHVEDLAQLLLAARGVRSETFVVGDDHPATQNEIAAWISEEWGVPMPPHVPSDQVHETLRSDRRVDGVRALTTLGVELCYPDYRLGMLKPKE
jgi:nucleoside-diphosphate-sugar epimerase